MVKVRGQNSNGKTIKPTENVRPYVTSVVPPCHHASDCQDQFVRELWWTYYARSNSRPFRSLEFLAPGTSDVMPAASSSPKIFWPFSAVCLTVFLFEFWPRIFTIQLYEKAYKIRDFVFGMQFSFKGESTKGNCLFITLWKICYQSSDADNKRLLQWTLEWNILCFKMYLLVNLSSTSLVPTSSLQDFPKVCFYQATPRNQRKWIDWWSCHCVLFRWSAPLCFGSLLCTFVADIFVREKCSEWRLRTFVLVYKFSCSEDTVILEIFVSD